MLFIQQKKIYIPDVFNALKKEKSRVKLVTSDHH